MSAADILNFFRNLKEFAQTLPVEAVRAWEAALDEIAEPLTSAPDSWRLRPAQIAAWRGVATERVALVLGPPGTGKTFVLSWMALAYVEARRRAGAPCRVLVTGFTRNSIANLLESVAEKAAHHSFSLPIFFAGNQPDAGTPAGVQGVPNVDAARDRLADEHLVCGCSVWMLYRMLDGAKLPGSRGPTAHVFDLVCIDEASQILLSQGLMALAGLAPGGRVLVAGDNRQLPPVGGVHEHEIEGRPLGVSLYDFLSQQGAREFALDETFRLNAPLTRFAEQKFYPGKYRSADEVARRRLALRVGWDSGLDELHRFALDPDYPIAVLLHDGPPYGTTNPFEVQVIARLTQMFWERTALAKNGEPPDARTFWQERLAVVSPHRAQNAAIREALRGRGLEEECVVETVDRIQGRERDCILACYTVSDPEFALAEASFIFSRERLNVTATRARSKLVLVVSQRLLEAIPPDEKDFDAAQVLREFVFSTTEVGAFQLDAGDGRRVAVALRLRGFDDGPALPTLGAAATPPIAYTLDLPPLTPALKSVRDAIGACAAASKYGTAILNEVSKRLYRKVAFEEFRALFRLGWIDLRQQSSEYGQFWTARPLDEQHTVLPATIAVVRARIEEVIHGARKSRFAPYYDNVRARFDWIAPDESDQLLPIVEQLAGERIVSLDLVNGKRVIDLADLAEAEPVPLPPPTETLSEADFRLLNQLESLEAGRINFGVFESWTAEAELSLDDPTPVHDSLRRLEAHGFLMRTEDGRIRSRMAELARELRYLKQRFTPGDADRRPYLVRGLKVRTVERQKPRPDTPFSLLREALAPKLGVRAAAVLDAIGLMLARDWRVQDPVLRGFQARSLSAILTAWLGHSDEDSFVITADTGSGKTEAACLPLIAGAAVDILAGVRGTRAVLVYPRIRLAANQAQRLARYLAGLAQCPGAPLLTLGVQNTFVPSRFSEPLPQDMGELWKRGDLGWTFPFFECPACSSQLYLNTRAGAYGADRLLCPACSWRYDGWVGSKEALRKTPPSLFIPVTESLHQWMQDGRYGALWGDTEENEPPRAVLADEIHLYTHVHGAQVGFALRRLLHRIRANSGGNRRPLAIGMSATLGDPGRTWSELVGRGRTRDIVVEPRERDENPRGREYYYFVQPEVESRGKDIAGASSTIQSLMCLAHGMRRRTGKEGGYRGLVFLDSIDKLRRLHTDFMDAEEGRRLAQLRTRLYGAPGSDQHECCRVPELCSAFRSGECWYFAATDEAQWTARGRYDTRRHLAIAEQPVYSGNRSNVEQMIRRSDIVFATSSLEVGYDDPDMMLVYQHYAPVNIASFVQRKGRGGRGADDRPVTGVTLSVYSPRDSWLFRRPEQLLDAAGFLVPLNMSNFFVRRGQALCAGLDALARRSARRGTANDPRNLNAETRRDVDQYVGELFESAFFSELGAATPSEFLAATCRSVASPPRNSQPRGWLDVIGIAPRTLFTSVNMPLLEVRPAQAPPVQEDVALVLSECAPGNVTRRFDARTAYWVPPRHGRSPLLPSTELSASPRFTVESGKVEDLLPDDPLAVLGPLTQEIVRPVALTSVAAGRFNGAEWNALWLYNSQQRRVVPRKPGDGQMPEVGAKTRGFLTGCSAVVADAERARELPCGAVHPLVQRVLCFQGGPRAGGNTGLVAYRLYWGAETELRLSSGDDESLTQTFVHPEHHALVQLYGYRLATEGVQIELDSRLLDQHVQQELERLRGTPEERGLNAQFFRFLVESRAPRIGIGAFDARRMAELLTAAATGDLREQFKSLLSEWDTQELAELLRVAFRRGIALHPLLSERRVEALIELLRGKAGLRDLVADAMRDVKAPATRARFLRTLALHGIAVRLKQLFVLTGRGDERRVLVHVRLPVQFSTRSSDAITLFEHGEHGDGTTRLFVERAAEAFSALRNGFLVECPNSAEDRLVAALAARTDRHAVWKEWDPRSERRMRQIAHELAVTADDGSLQTALRLLHGAETVSGRRFELLALHREIADLARELEEKRLGRPAMPWEFVTWVVHAAADPSGPRLLRDILQAYRVVPDASNEERLSPEARLAEQVYRLGVPLCRDGCPACVRAGSDVMTDSLAESTVSRSALVRLVTLAGWP